MYWYQYLLFMLPAYLFVLIIRTVLKSTVSKYSAVNTGINGRLVLSLGGASGVPVNQVRGDLTDNYDPASNTIFLSETVYDKYSVAAVGIAAHEAGHALQYHENYAPARIRQASVKICNIGSRFSIPLMILGFILSFKPLVIAGIVSFMLVVAFQLITLPVEFNASHRAITVLSDSGRFTAEEIKGVRKVLNAAAMTYVGSLAVSALQLVYNITRFKGR